MSSIKSSSTVGLNQKWSSMVGDAKMLSSNFFKNNQNNIRKIKNNERLDVGKKYYDWQNKYESQQKFTGAHKSEIKSQFPFSNVAGAQKFIEKCNTRQKEHNYQDNFKPNQNKQSKPTT